MHYRTQEAVTGKIFAALTNAAQNVTGRTDALLASVSYSNPNASAVWLQFFAKAAADVIVGTTEPACAIALTSSFAWHQVVDYTGAGFGGPISVAATTTPNGGIAPGLAVSACVFVR